jgi:hypothetical protein
MNVFNVEILSYDKDTGTHTVSYCVGNGKGTVRRSKALYRNGELSRDNDKQNLKEIIKDKLILYRSKT